MIPDVLKPYWNYQGELSVEYKCMLWGVRMIVPMEWREEVLKELHQRHIGIVHMHENDWEKLLKNVCMVAKKS